MTQTEFTKFYDSYKHGSYTKLIKQKTSGNYKKVTTMIIRFVNYFNIKSVKEKQTDSTQIKTRDYEIQIIPHVLKLNTNTNNLLLSAYKTNKHKAYTKYYLNDIEITENEYYLNSGDKKRNNNDTIIFNFKLCDVLKIGN